MQADLNLGHMSESTFSDVAVHFNVSYYSWRVNCLTFKMPRKLASENVVCLCRLLNILANFSNSFLYTGKQCKP